MNSGVALLAGLLALLLVLGLSALGLSRRQRISAGLPQGKVVSADMGGWRRPEKALFSAEHGLASRPDYLVQQGRYLIPVEVKPTRTARLPYRSDVLQLGAYCLLVEDAMGRPPHGLLRYREQTFQIPYTRRLRRHVLAALADMRRLAGARDVRPNHREPRRCVGCGHRSHCAHRMG